MDSEPLYMMTIRLNGNLDDDLSRKFLDFINSAQKTFDIRMDAAIYLTDNIKSNLTRSVETSPLTP